MISRKKTLSLSLGGKILSFSDFPSHSLSRKIARKNPPPPGGFPIYYVPSSRNVCNRTPLEEFVPGASRGVLLHTVLDREHSK